MRTTEWDLIADGCSLTVSVGVATRPPRGLLAHDVERDMAELLGRADEALYGAKRAGRDQVVLRLSQKMRRGPASEPRT